MMWYWGAGVHWWGWLLGIASMLVFWGLLIWAVVAVAGWARREGSPRKHGETAEVILARRFAAGEIDADEYRQRLATLRGGEVTLDRSRR